jgi:hypothetical protein
LDGWKEAEMASQDGERGWPVGRRGDGLTGWGKGLDGWKEGGMASQDGLEVGGGLSGMVAVLNESFFFKLVCYSVRECGSPSVEDIKV